MVTCTLEDQNQKETLPDKYKYLMFFGKDFCMYQLQSVYCIACYHVCHDNVHFIKFHGNIRNVGLVVHTKVVYLFTIGTLPSNCIFTIG